ncbi:hypothetical protein HWV62_13617 [Athelia sp. TMB]|nr:hypothetical protein HWV62_13617 [Athelia sp. TMB]
MPEPTWMTVTGKIPVHVSQHQDLVASTLAALAALGTLLLGALTCRSTRPLSPEPPRALSLASQRADDFPSYTAAGHDMAQVPYPPNAPLAHSTHFTSIRGADLLPADRAFLDALEDVELSPLEIARIVTLLALGAPAESALPPVLVVSVPDFGAEEKAFLERMCGVGVAKISRVVEVVREQRGREGMWGVVDWWERGWWPAGVRAVGSFAGRHMVGR